MEPVAHPGADRRPTSGRRIEAGLAQRARLLDALLHDLYGPQRMLTEGSLPPELVFENPCFLRACHGMSVPRDRWLPLYGADLVRVPDGGFAVLEDRTQAPSGAGYALENRIVISSVLPEAFRDCNVERLALFFRALRDTLQSLAPHNRDNPRIVLLTPGPVQRHLLRAGVPGAVPRLHAGQRRRPDGARRPRVPEDAGRPAAGRRDPAPRQRRLLRSARAAPDSMLGVPGLVQAARAGNVAIASPLGTGVLQTPRASCPTSDGCAARCWARSCCSPSVRTLLVRRSRRACARRVASFDDAVVKHDLLRTASCSRCSRRELDRGRARRAAARRSTRGRAHYVVQERVHASTTPLLDDRHARARARW